MRDNLIMNTNNIEQTIADMITVIEEKGDTPHFTIGYLTGMIERFADKHPDVLKDCINVIERHNNYQEDEGNI